MNAIFPFKGIRVHHAGIDMRQFKDPAKTIRAWHLQRGFHDIGYHALIDPDSGLILAGRSWNRAGAHDLHENDTFGICFLADYSREAPKPPALNGAILLCRLVAELCGFDPREDGIVQGHREWDPLTGTDATECPGKMLDMDHFRMFLRIYWGDKFFA